MKKLIFIVAMLFAVIGCGLFEQDPVCKPQYPHCMPDENLPPVNAGAPAHDAGADTRLQD